MLGSAARSSAAALGVEAGKSGTKKFNLVMD
jgi:hypothetical protein